MNVYEQIKHAIMVGDFKPGQKLTEEDLAKRFNKSRTPIREAIKKLSGEGLIEVTRNVGMTVKDFSYEEIKQIYNLRVILEGYAASQAAMHRSKEDINLLKKENELFYNAITELASESSQGKKEMVLKLTEHNNKFHKTIIKAGKNNYLEFLVSNILFIPLIFKTFYSFDITIYKKSYYDHVRIIEAIENSDADRAKSAMQEHVYQGRDQSLVYFKKYFNE